LEKREDELVWMQRRKRAERRTSKRLKRCSKRGESSAAQRGKSAAKQCMVRRTGKRSKRGGSRKEVRRTFKMLRKVWLNIGVEKIDTLKGCKGELHTGTNKTMLCQLPIAC